MTRSQMFAYVLGAALAGACSHNPPPQQPQPQAIPYDAPGLSPGAAIVDPWAQSLEPTSGAQWEPTEQTEPGVSAVPVDPYPTDSTMPSSELDLDPGQPPQPNTSVAPSATSAASDATPSRQATPSSAGTPMQGGHAWPPIENPSGLGSDSPAPTDHSWPPIENPSSGSGAGSGSSSTAAPTTTPATTPSPTTTTPPATGSDAGSSESPIPKLQGDGEPAVPSTQAPSPPPE